MYPQNDQATSSSGLSVFGRGEHSQFGRPSAETAARMALQAPMPGEVVRNDLLDSMVDEFQSFGVQGKGKMPIGNEGRQKYHQAPQFNEFEEIFNRSMLQRQQQPSLGHPGAEAALPVLQAFLHEDVHGMVAVGQRNSHLIHRQSSSIPELNISDKCRVRDRSTILARQMFVDRGPEYINQHVYTLLQSLNIDPASLPEIVQGNDMASWDAIFGHGVAADHAAGQVSQRARSGKSVQWADDFLTSGSGAIQNKSVSDEWVDDYEKATVSAVGVAGVDKDVSTSAIEHSRRLAETLAASADPKLQNSQFLKFVSKMSRGELIMEGNEVKEIPSASSEWAQEFSGAQRMPWADEFTLEQESDLNKSLNKDGANWAEQFANGLTTSGQWAEEFAEGKYADDGTVANWEEEYFAELERLHTGKVISSSGQYRMSENNPFLTDMDSFSKGRELFQRGLLTEAVLAIEAECQRNPTNSEAWRLLGTVQAENDDDIQAIAAMNKALACDPDNLEVLFSLGVSYTNELDHKAALDYLRQWLVKNPRHRIALDPSDMPDSSQRLSHTINLFQEAAAAEPQDADVHAALGVLFNLSRRYGEAISAFRKAINLNSGDYSLWNKLGATLANSAQSAEALSAYRKALELKPNYMRAWANMGISLANLGHYEDSAKYYVRALTLNKDAGAVWGYLRTSVMCEGREDLMALVDQQNLTALQRLLPL